MILEGRVEAVPLDEALVSAYEQKYDFRLAGFEDELWLRVRPSAAYAWTEQDLPRTATRFRP